MFEIPEYIEVRNASGDRVAFLSPEADALKDAWIDRRLNEESTLKFSLPLTSDKWDEIGAETKFIVNNMEFVLLKPDSIDIVRDRQGRLWGNVTAVESWKLLDKEYVTVSNDPQNPEPPDLAVIILSGGPSTGGYPQGSAGSALSYLLAGSDWELDICDVDGTYDLETEKESLLSNIQQVQKTWGGYLVWDSINKKVSLRAEDKWQEYKGFQVRYRKNLKHITKTANYDIVTRLYPFGENDLDISSVNSGVKYIENFSYTNNVYTGTYIDQGIHDAQQLKDRAEKVLEKMSKPRYTYRVNVVDLRSLPEYSHEEFDLGHLVDVIDQDIGVNINARIVRYRYKVFEPWNCELEIGEPEERLVSKLKDTFDVSRFIQDALKPSRATSKLLRGFIDTFTTTINSANGKLVWNDATLEAIEIDGGGNETGNRVRVTPGGIGISTDGGQTYVTAMTGQGILANTIIVNELYALATDDGYTKLTASGLHVFDPSLAERLVAGWWMDGVTKRFGLNVKAEDGATTLLDDRGLLQTWQEGRADNVQSNYPLVLNVYLPPETRSIGKALLRFRRQNFRAYSTGAASGGGHTTPSGGGTTSGSSSQNTTVSADEQIDVTGYRFDSGPDVDYTRAEYADADSHNHGIPDGTALATAGGGSVTFVAFSGSTHAHWLPPHSHYHTAYGHSHGMDHTHYCPDHQHTVNDHTHPINYGIYTSTLPTNITIKINGVDRTSILGGPFDSDQSNLDISSYLNIGQWNIIELGSNSLGRIDATVFVQALMGL